MRVKCDLCDREATVHEVNIKDGEKVERHLCEQCAREEGIAVQAHAPIGDLITKFVMSHSAARRQKTAAHCQECGMTFDEFRQHGVLGCPGCYSSFEEQLGPLLERAHDGAAHHVGKVPRRAGSSMERHELIASLRRQLSEAIDSEQYEKAATLRDQLIEYESGEEPDAGGEESMA